MKNKILRIINTLATMSAGFTLSSLLITESNRWHYSLPICLLLITLRNSLKDSDE